MVAQMVTVGCSAPRSTSSPPHGQYLADADAGGEHEIDDIGQVAGVPRSRLAGSGLLPLADRRADGFQVFGFEGPHGAAWLAKATGLTKVCNGSAGLADNSTDWTFRARAEARARIVLSARTAPVRPRRIW
ncbi:hypothetical protein KRMM14A1259_36170 [Krasilnikovia sp. MM14-A1259]